MASARDVGDARAIVTTVRSRIVAPPPGLALVLVSACSGMPASLDAGATDSALADVVDASVVPLGDAGTCGTTTLPAPDPLRDRRSQCAFHAGASADETLGLDPSEHARVPITHLIVVTQENRSYDHYFAHLADALQPEAERVPESYANPDRSGALVHPEHLATTCIANDPPHQWSDIHGGWDDGAMDGFVRNASSATNDGHYVMGYYDQRDIPFYYWLASTFALGDRHFAAALSGTWSNRNFLYTGTSAGVRYTGERTVPDQRTVFDQLDEAHVSWGVYSDGTPRQDSLGWSFGHRGVGLYSTLVAALRTGSLPRVSFVDPGPMQDEHPPLDIQRGEAWSRSLYEAARASPLWPHLAIVFTYDENGGFADHVAPPPACPPSDDLTEWDTLGVRVPLIVVSPYARPHSVSHRTHSHTSILRLIQWLHGLPALTERDANSDALLDLFDFGCPRLLAPETTPAAGTGGCVMPGS